MYTLSIWTVPSGWRHTSRWLAVLTCTVMATLVCARDAYAETGPPVFNTGFGVEAYSTRVQIEGNLWEEGSPTEWRGELASSCNGPWSTVNSYPAGGPNKSYVYLGEKDPFALGALRSAYLFHLKPETTYCARFTAKNADGATVSEAFPFKTLAVAKPEVPKKEQGEFTRPDFSPPDYACQMASDTVASCEAEIESNGAETSYSFEYASAERGGGRPSEASGLWKAFSSGATGVVSVAQDAVDAQAGLTGLTPETTYYVRLRMRNTVGETVQTTYAHSIGGNHPGNEFESFRTPPARPIVEDFVGVRNVTASSAVATGALQVAGSETHWRFEYAESVMGPWSAVPGGEGTVSRTQAEATSYYQTVNVAARLTGLSPATAYYVRVFAENAAGEGKICYGGTFTADFKFAIDEEEEKEYCEAVTVADRVSGGFPVTFTTEGSPSVATFMVHGLVGEQLRLIGGVNPESKPTSSEQVIAIEGSPTGGTFRLTFDGKTTVPIAYDAPATPGHGPEAVSEALEGIGLGGLVEVEGSPGGPYTVVFGDRDAGVSEPQIECSSQLTPSGACSGKIISKGGESSETHYRFEYVSQASFTEHGWSEASMTPEETAVPGSQLEAVHGLLPVLTAGETYRYRLVATSSIPGVGTIEGPEETLKVPSFTVSPTPSPCPNEAFRTGLSAHLPDCRAYELVTPVEKGGSLEPWYYEPIVQTNVQVGEDGDHLVVNSSAGTVNWGSAGDSPYLFTREAGKGWTMSTGSPQPVTGIATHLPQLFSDDLTQMAFESSYQTSSAGDSEQLEYFVGPVAGPYTKVASIPRSAGLEAGQWVAMNKSFSKLVLKSRDHSLLGSPTGTRSGYDLYEYTAQGGLQQLNVNGEPRSTIGSCGAQVARGREGGYGSGALFAGAQSGLNTISADGSRVFFYASAPHECASEDELSIETQRGIGPNVNLYVRVDGSETFDIGPYKFLGANEQGTRVLLENSNGEQFGYDSEAGTLQPQSNAEKETASEMALLGVPYQAEPKGDEALSHPRYTYWSGAASYQPMKNGQGEETFNDQVYRYDSMEHVVQCISCASPYDPAPKQPSFLNSGFGENVRSTIPLLRDYSENGQFAFFFTSSALVPQDVDGEISPEEYNDAVFNGVESIAIISPSTDVYEWRAAGVDGCEHVQGCLALITDGRGGHFSSVLGSAEEGHEVFIYTHAKLLPRDVDTSGDIYAVRVDGGFAPPPPRPTECEGDACSTAPASPTDATPSSLTFSGTGNVTGEPSASTKTVKKKGHKKKTRKRSRRGKHVRARRGRRSSVRAARRAAK
jgi:hypothetical protein